MLSDFIDPSSSSLILAIVIFIACFFILKFVFEKYEIIDEESENYKLVSYGSYVGISVVVVVIVLMIYKMYLIRTGRATLLDEEF